MVLQSNLRIKKDTIYLNKYWDIPIEYHPLNNGKIIINIPGAGGSINGYMDKYLNLGNDLQKRYMASFVRIPNDRPQKFINTARVAINYCLDNSSKICDSRKPEIWLMGSSAGGASILLTGWEYPEVTKILAINPFIDLPEIGEGIQKYLPEYTGELFAVRGEKDTVTNKDTLDYITKYAINVKELQTYIIAGCDHQFKGERNVRILSQLPEYYFLGKYKSSCFPYGDTGINLLENLY